MNNVVKLEPFYKEAVWGSESWLVSSHENGRSLIDDKALDFDIPYLVKKIKTHKNLSIQVHPKDLNSKNESWLITDHEKHAGIYLGFKENIKKSDFERAIRAKEDISKLLNFIPVKKGDFFFIPAGTIHAIGEDIELVEIQETSDTTFRVWDWNREGLDGKPRELHIDKALACLNFNAFTPESLNINDLIFTKEEILSFKGIHIELLNLRDKQEITFKLKNKSSLLVLEGEISIANKKIQNQNSYLSISDSSINLRSDSESKVLKIRYSK